jgi:hypothetical protein
MWEPLSIVVLAVGLLTAPTCTLAAEEPGVIELAAPRSAARGDAFEVEVTTGQLPRGARLTLLTENGEILGGVAPFPPGARSSTATVPVPRSAVTDGRLRLRLQVLEPGAPARPPRSGEVERVDLFLVPRSE